MNNNPDNQNNEAVSVNSIFNLDQVTAFFEGQSIQNITAAIKALQGILAKKQDKNKKDNTKKLKEMVEEFGFTEKDIAKIFKIKSRKSKTDDASDEAPKAKRKPRKIKYRDTQDPINTWTGAGLKPKWLQERLSQGAKLEDFKVVEAD